VNLDLNQFTLPVAAKAYVALIGAIAVALLPVFTDGDVHKWLTIVVIVATAVGTWAVPKAEPKGGDMEKNEDGVYEMHPVVLGLAVVAVVLIILLLVGVL